MTTTAVIIEDKPEDNVQSKSSRGAVGRPRVNQDLPKGRKNIINSSSKEVTMEEGMFRREKDALRESEDGRGGNKAPPRQARGSKDTTQKPG